MDPTSLNQDFWEIHVNSHFHEQIGLAVFELCNISSPLIAADIRKAMNYQRLLFSKSGGNYYDIIVFPLKAGFISN